MDGLCLSVCLSVCLRTENNLYILRLFLSARVSNYLLEGTQRAISHVHVT